MGATKTIKISSTAIKILFQNFLKKNLHWKQLTSVKVIIYLRT